MKLNQLSLEKIESSQDYKSCLYFESMAVALKIEPLKCLFPDRKLNPQTIRMSVICNWLNERKLTLEQTQELAGHKWIGTTEKYINSDAKNERELINRYFPKL